MKAGDRVLVIGRHPWTGRSGELIGSEEICIPGHPPETGWRVRLDVGWECFAADHQLEALPQAAT